MSRAAIVNVLSLLLLVGCGGSGSPFTANPVGDLVVDSFPAPIRSLEGTIVNAETVVRDGLLAVGDNKTDHEVRSFVAWMMPTPRADQTLEVATLKLHNHGESGQPFQRLGSFHIELVDPGTTLDPEDATRVGTARVSLDGLDTGVIELDVTPLVQQAVDSGAARLAFRMRFESAVAPGGTADRVVFAAYTLEATELPPTLTLGWRTSE